MDNRPNVAILGGGHAAFAHAADLSLRGFTVSLFELPEMAENLARVRELGGIESQPHPSTGLEGGFGRIDRVTSNARHAIAGADVIFLVVPAFAQKAFARAIATHLSPEQIVVLSPGSFGGATLFAQALQQGGCTALPRLCEAQSMIYACRKTGPASVMISGYKEGLRVAVFPARLTDEVIPVLQRVFPSMEPAENILWTWLSNPNPVGHPPITILNAGWVENTGGDFLFYLQGATPSVQKVVDALDRERVSVGEAFGLALIPNHLLTELWYGHQARRLGSGKTAQELVYAAIKSETQLDSRYLTEDLPYGLVPWEDMGRLVGIETPICSSLIDLGDTLLESDFRQTGLTLTRIGLGDMNGTQLHRYVTEGDGAIGADIA
ncbi:MAG: NAD(P)-binding domain-containing protein [Chloroflexi bacterium]|nr:NAD(P)-binding domain-containing protein [Chloroflexota bacterium]